jgi:hypothetical protein
LSDVMRERVYAMAPRQISEEEYLRKFRPEEYEKRRKLGIYSDATPQPQNVPGLPPPEARYSPEEIRGILLDSGSLKEYGRGGTRAGSQMDRAAQQIAVQDEIARQQLLDAGVDGLVAGMSQAVGAPVDRNTALLAREYMTMPGGEALELSDAVRLAAASGAVQGQIPAELSAKVAQLGEIGRDQGLDVVLKAANQGLIDPSLPIEAQIDALDPESKAKLALLARVQGQIEQLNAEETGLAANALGLGRTVGGRRNSFRKEKRGNEEAAVLRTPGSVLSQGMEFKADDILLPFVIAPKNQQVWSSGKAAGPYSDVSGPVMQAAQYYNGDKFAPSLRDAQVLYVNPYGEVSDAVVSRLGLDLVQNPIEKDVSGGYDQESLNVPVPDVGQERYGLRPKDDPSFGMDAGASYRNPTFAEAVNALSLKYRTPIGVFTEDMLAGGGRGYSDVLVNQPGREVFALGSKRRPDGKPAPIADYFQEPAEPGEPRVADVRIGSGQKRTPEFYAALDDLIDAVALEAYGAPGQAYGDPGVIEERSTGNRYAPAAASPMPGEAKWGSLMNLRSTDPVVADYQRRLLSEAGFPINTSAANPLLGVVDVLEQLAGAPPSDTDVRRGVLTAAAAEPLVAVTGQAGAARILEAAKQRASELRGRTRPTTDNARQTYEKAISDLVKRGVGSGEPRVEARAVEPKPQVSAATRRARASQPIIPGLEGDVRFPANALDPVTRDLARYMAERAPQVGTRNPEQVVQYVPAELFNRFFTQQAPEGAGGGTRQGELQLNPLQRGMADALFGRSDRAARAGGYTASYIDDVAQYMEAQQKQRALEEKASTAPVLASTNTVQESLLNAPASPKSAPTAMADELLKRRLGRMTGR